MSQDKCELRVGDAVYFYASPSSDQPFMAWVGECYPNGMVNLAVWMAGKWHNRERVFHRLSDHIKQNPQNALKMGTWDYKSKPAPPVENLAASVPDDAGAGESLTTPAGPEAEKSSGKKPVPSKV